MLGVCDVEWPNSGQYDTENEIICYSENHNSHYRYGVAVMILKDTNKLVVNFIPMSNCVMLLRLQTKHCKLNIIQVYALIADKRDEKIFYEQISRILKSS